MATSAQIRGYAKEHNCSNAEAKSHFIESAKENRSQVVDKLMGVYSNTRKEIKKPVGLYIGYKPKNHVEGNIYKTWRITADHDDIMEVKRMSDRDGLKRDDLSGALWEYFRNDKYEVDIDGNCIDETHALANAVMAYLTTYKGYQGANTGYLMTIKEWDPSNPNGANHGGIRLKANGFEKHSSYTDWNEWTAENQADQDEIKGLFDGCFLIEDHMADGTITGVA